MSVRSTGVEGGENRAQSMEEELHVHVVREEGEPLGGGAGPGAWLAKKWRRW